MMYIPIGLQISDCHLKRGIPGVKGRSFLLWESYAQFYTSGTQNLGEPRIKYNSRDILFFSFSLFTVEPYD